MTSKMIAVSLPEELIEILKLQASIHYESRSEYIKRAIVQRLQADGVDISLPTKSKIPKTQEAKQEELNAFLASYDPNNPDASG